MKTIWSNLNYMWKMVKQAPGGHFKIKMQSYWHSDSHHEDKTVSWPSYLDNGDSYTWTGNIFTLSHLPGVHSKHLPTLTITHTVIVSSSITDMGLFMGLNMAGKSRTMLDLKKTLLQTNNLENEVINYQTIALLVFKSGTSGMHGMKISHKHSHSSCSCR